VVGLAFVPQLPRGDVVGASFFDTLEPDQQQVLYRAINEQIYAISPFVDREEEFELVCECTKPGCVERCLVSAQQYNAIRRFPTHFIVRPGHTDDSSERLVSSVGETFVVIEKFGAGAQIAIRDDPRRRVADLRSRRGFDA
jgi:hypothetical protein